MQRLDSFFFFSKRNGEKEISPLIYLVNDGWRRRQTSYGAELQKTVSVLKLLKTAKEDVENVKCSKLLLCYMASVEYNLNFCLMTHESTVFFNRINNKKAVCKKKN